MCTVREISDTRKAVDYVLKDGSRGTTAPFEFDDEMGERTLEDPVIAGALEASGIAMDDIDDWHVRAYLEPDVIYISDHAMMRLKKRLGWKKNAAIRMTKKAVEEGLTRDDVDSTLKNWIEYKETNTNYNSSSDIHYKIYGQIAYVFDRQVLCTVYNLTAKETVKAHNIRRKGYNRAAYKRGEF